MVAQTFDASTQEAEADPLLCVKRPVWFTYPVSQGYTLRPYLKPKQKNHLKILVITSKHIVNAKLQLTENYFFIVIKT